MLSIYSSVTRQIFSATSSSVQSLVVCVCVCGFYVF